MKRVMVLMALSLSGCDAQEASEAKALLQEGLYDGDRARFENVVYTVLPDGQQTVCGWVNAKNRMGGYVGFERFLVLDGRIVLHGSRRSSESADTLFGQCVAVDQAASDRMFRDTGRALDAYEAALGSQ